LISTVTEDAFSDIMALEETLLLGVFDMSITNSIGKIFKIIIIIKILKINFYLLEKELKLKKLREFDNFK
jgi:hypothetical protein